MPRHINALDGLRGFGIFFVMFYHYFGSHKYPWLGFSWVWVQMFFVQSGFLITKLLLDDRASIFASYVKRFYWRRSLRILPPYLLFLLIFIFSYAAFRKPQDFLAHLPYLATYTYNLTRLVPSLHYNLNFIHLWSLSIEEQFYLLWPLVVYFASRRRLKQLLVLIAVLGPVCRGLLAAYLTQYHPATNGLVGFDKFAVGEAVYTFTFSQWDGFAIGAMIPIFGLTERVRRPGRWALAFLGLTVCAGALNLAFYEGERNLATISALGLAVASTGNGQHIWSYSLVNLTFLFVVLHASRSDYRGVFAMRPFVSVGKVAYGLYIYHFPILVIVGRVCERFHLPAAIGFVLSCAVSVLIAKLSYRFFESKLLLLKDKVGGATVGTSVAENGKCL